MVKMVKLPGYGYYIFNKVKQFDHFQVVKVKVRLQHYYPLNFYRENTEKPVQG
jgi:hypothetical protein